MKKIHQLRVRRLSDGEVLLYRKAEIPDDKSGDYKDFSWSVHTHWYGHNHEPTGPVAVSAPAQHWTFRCDDIEVRQGVPHTVRTHYFPMGLVTWELDFGEGYPLEPAVPPSLKSEEAH
jgi:hypothetical protein